MNSYRKAPCFDDVYPIISELINSNEVNLFKYISESLIAICKYLNLNSSKIKVSSEINIDHSLKSEEKVLAGFIRPPKSCITKEPNLRACSFEKESATTKESKLI